MKSIRKRRQGLMKSDGSFHGNYSEFHSCRETQKE